MYAPAGAPERLTDLVWIPISGESKEPRVKFKGAQVSPWRQRPGDGFGILTGPSPMTDLAVWVLDLDIGDGGAYVLGGGGYAQLDEWMAERGHSWDELQTLTLKTGSGGMHLVFLLDPEQGWVKGGAGHTELGPDVDVRGGRLVNGEVAGTGYFKAPPSDDYVVVEDRPLIVAPAWLYEIVKWQPVVARARRKTSASAPPRSRLAKAISSGTSDPLGRARAWVNSAIEALGQELDWLWEKDNGWHATALSVTASLAGLVEHDLLAELGLTSETWAWDEVMSRWAEMMDDGAGFYEKHLEPAFLGKLGVADPARLPDDLEEALIDLLEDRRSATASPVEKVTEADDFDYESLTLTDEVDPPVEWLLPDLLVKGMMNVITGPPKTVKSTIAGFLASRVGNRVVWVSRDNEHRGSIQRRLQAAGLTGQARILEDKHTPTPEILMERLEVLAEWVGPSGLFVFDSLAGMNRMLGEGDEYSNAASRKLWQQIHRAVDGVTILLVAHASQKDESNFMMGSQAIHQLLVHLLRARRSPEGLVTVSVEMSRYAPTGPVLLAGQLPGQDPSEVPPIIELEFEKDGALLIAKEKRGEPLREALVTAIGETVGIDSGDETTLGEWPRHCGLSAVQIAMAQSAGLLEVRDGSKRGKVSLHTTELYGYLAGSADDDDW